MISTQRTVDIVVSLIRDRILQGEYPIGSCLPAERKLAESLQVNRLTLRSALRHLEAEGLLRPHHGQGVIVQNYNDTASIELLAYISNPEHLSELSELRKLIAAEAVSYACMEANINDINRLHSILVKQKECHDDQEFLEGDLHFMRILVESGNNFTLKLLFNSFERITRARSELHSEITSHKAQACSSYHALIALIRNRNETLAKKAILGYLTETEATELANALANI